MPEAFNRVVVEVDVSDLAIRRQRVGVDGKAVILSGYLDPSGGQIFDRLITAMMAEGQFVGASAKRQAHELMAQTDSKNRKALH